MGGMLNHAPPTPARVRPAATHGVKAHHREATHSPVQVAWFTDRIEILSPGGPYGDVSAATFGQPGLIDYRNPNLAEAMRVSGLVQRFLVAAGDYPAPTAPVTDTSQSRPMRRTRACTP